MPVLGATGWFGALCGLQLGPAAVILGAALLGGTAWWRHRSAARGSLTLAACSLVFLAVGAVAVVRLDSRDVSPLADLAETRTFARLEGVIATDPSASTGKYADFVIVRVQVRKVSGRGQTYVLSAPALVLAEMSWSTVRLGSTVHFSGLLSESEGDDVTAVVRARGAPDIVAGPPPWWRAAERVRSALRESVAHSPADQRALVPALVVGDDADVDDSLAAAFKRTGLTHLLAVSGTNLTLLVGFLLVAARWCGVRGRGLYAVGAAGIVGFILLARFEPSVVRAAAMGTVGLLAMGINGRQRGGRALGVAVLVVLLVDPDLAISPGFALSVLATVGIVFLAPPWRDALALWMPRWLAEAVAVPAAAQLACTPLVASLSGQVSLVAVAANLLAGPAVGPATVLGLLGGFLGLVWSPLGRIAGTLAAWCAGWIVLIARRGADLPTPSIAWGTDLWGLVALTALSLVVAVITPHVLRRRVPTLMSVSLVAVVVLFGLPTPGWPPRNWILVACDIGQGDGLVLNAGNGAAVVVDAGPDPDLMDRCLDRLGVDTVSLVVLSHFHADHVDGLSGVLRGRSVGRIETTSLLSPMDRAATVRALAAKRGSSVGRSPLGVTQRVGNLLFESIWPQDDTVASTDEGSGPNNASVVMLVETQGIRMLLTGDVEPAAQARLARVLAGQRVDVLKVPHHGSRFQDFDLLTGLRPRVALISVGADNDYGHPAPETLSRLKDAGIRVWRTDTSGDVAVLVESGRLSVVTHDFSPG